MTVTTTEAALQRTIASHPCDDTPVLVLADYLEELSQYDPSERERARDARLIVAHRDIIRNPDDVGARLAWAGVAESVPVDEAALAEVRRELAKVAHHRPGYNGGASTGMRDPMREWREAVAPLRAREAALARTTALHRRAEYVRVQCEIADLCALHQDDRERPEDTRRLHELQATEGRLLYEHGETLVKDFAASVGLNCFSVDHGTHGSVNLHWDWSRGFIEHLTCTAERWFGSDRAPGLCEKLWWDAGQTVPCGACKGTKQVAKPTGNRCPECDRPGRWRSGVGFEHEKICMSKSHARSVVWEPGGTLNVNCTTCHGEGRLPRPIPTTAVPLRKLTLTTWPSLQWYTRTATKHKLWMFAPTPREEPVQLNAAVMQAEFPGLACEIRPQ